ncbi:NAD(P)H-dependent oxidoreductase [Stakelama sp. CBK3Z-3]|uniref:NAD(P)H-dependent oxidoreductase n=1 Tax=Stakelama flava TaxID=2860338 RepID=A0ABS6XHR3_9SPHN|nr:NAD(P)H-dependent oxidoreductase [Stakelama flava]MBW4329434.1 NAD(P)H-dependent oxidoreductase [Stakelama flava]
MGDGPSIVGIGGTTRPGSSTEMLVRAVLGECEMLGAHTQMFAGAELLALPHYNPGEPQRTDGQRALVEAARGADGFVIGTPGYHGSVSALVKNAIDLLEDTRTDARVYMDGCPVGQIVSAAGWQATGVTLSALRDIIHSLRGWPTPIGIGVNTIVQRPFDESGAIIDESIAGAVKLQAQQVMEHVRGTHMRRAAK